MKKVLLTTVMSLMVYMGVYAQDYLYPPKANELVLRTISSGNSVYRSRVEGNSIIFESATYGTMKEWYEALLKQAKDDYPMKTIDIRDMKVGKKQSYDGWCYTYSGPASGKVVVDLGELLDTCLSKALHNIHEGSRMAIDKITVSNALNSDNVKDQLLDVLLDKGYRVVAKEYLERLYKEQQDQESGIFNDSTTVQKNNFSAVGYFINVKVSENAIRAQVVNVSTGEYEGNATVNY